jgi:DNA-binding transcriptional ArsR family regulator
VSCVRDISEQAAGLLVALRHPVRLRILIALEERPRSPTEMAEDLGEPFDRVNHAMRAMARAGLVALDREEPAVAAPNLMRRIYAVRFRGWRGVLDALEAVADARVDDAAG